MCLKTNARIAILTNKKKEQAFLEDRKSTKTKDKQLNILVFALKTLKAKVK